MPADLILWGQRPDGVWVPIEKGTPAAMRRERADRTPSPYWRDLRTLKVGTSPERSN